MISDDNGLGDSGAVSSARAEKRKNDRKGSNPNKGIFNYKFVCWLSNQLSL